MIMEWFILHSKIFWILLMLVGTLYCTYVYFKVLGFNPIGAMETLKYKRFKRTLIYTIFSFALHIAATIVYILDESNISGTLIISFAIAYLSAVSLLLRNIVHSTKKYIIFAAKYKDDKFYSNKYKI